MRNKALHWAAETIIDILKVSLMPKKYCLALFFSVTAGIPVAEADQNDSLAANNAVSVVTDQKMFEFGGYGTLGATHSSVSSADYVLDAPMPSGAGRSGYWSPSDNSKIAAHLNATFTPSVTAIFQVISEYNSNGNYRPEIEWFNVKYAVSPDFFVRVGRFALPTFLDSDNHDVGYSYTWTHPPIDLYQQMPITSVDGVNLSYRFALGEAVNSIKAIFGQNTSETAMGVITSKNMRGIFDNIEYGQTTVHIGYQQRSSSTRSDLAGIAGEWIPTSDISAGVNYDPGNWFFKSEWLQDRSAYKTGAMYVSAGYRVKKFTPYLTHSQSSAASPYLSTASAQEFANRSQRTNSAGVRWDFMKNFDFKMQYDRITLGDNSNGYLVNVQNSAALFGTTFHVISAVVDFVF